MKEEKEFLTLEQFMVEEGFITKKLSELKEGDILLILPEFGAGKAVVQSILYGRDNKPCAVVVLDRGILHPKSFFGITED
jgi:hypothetical protein